MTLHYIYTLLNLIGTFVFALSGAMAARQRGLDWFGIATVAFTVACGGGMLRDLCLGATPPEALSDWHLLALAVCASAVTIAAGPSVLRFRNPVLFFDAIGLGLFAVSGAQKAWALGHNAEMAILLGMVTAVGGGVFRDVLLSRVPAILEREIYAVAALLGAGIFVGFEYAGLTSIWTPWCAALTCIGLRLLSLRYGWHFPGYRESRG